MEQSEKEAETVRLERESFSWTAQKEQTPFRSQANQATPKEGFFAFDQKFNKNTSVNESFSEVPTNDSIDKSHLEQLSTTIVSSTFLNYFQSLSQHSTPLKLPPKPRERQSKMKKNNIRTSQDILKSMEEQVQQEAVVGFLNEMKIQPVSEKLQQSQNTPKRSNKPQSYKKLHLKIDTDSTEVASNMQQSNKSLFPEPKSLQNSSRNTLKCLQKESPNSQFSPQS